MYGNEAINFYEYAFFKLLLNNDKMSIFNKVSIWHTFSKKKFYNAIIIICEILIINFSSKIRFMTTEEHTFQSLGVIFDYLGLRRISRSLWSTQLQNPHPNLGGKSSLYSSRKRHHRPCRNRVWKNLVFCSSYPLKSLKRALLLLRSHYGPNKVSYFFFQIFHFMDLSNYF